MEIQQIRLALCEDATVSRNPRSHAVNRLEMELGGLQ
jgi:hypothetical protein